MALSYFAFLQIYKRVSIKLIFNDFNWIGYANKIPVSVKLHFGTFVLIVKFFYCFVI
jgi:hypothetical protein